MTDDFMKWAGLDEARWQLLLDKLSHLAGIKTTPAEVMMALMNDSSISDRERVLVCYWLGFQHGRLGKNTPAVLKKRYMLAGMN